MAKNSAPIPKDPAARRAYTRHNVAVHRAKKAAALLNIQTSINLHRQRLGLPPRDYSGKPATPRGPRPVYLPPDEVMAAMTNEELTRWKMEERRKRKLAKGREKKAMEEAMAKELRRELEELERRVKYLDEAGKCVLPVAVKSAAAAESVEAVISADPLPSNKIELAQSSQDIGALSYPLAIKNEAGAFQTSKCATTASDADFTVLNADLFISVDPSISSLEGSKSVAASSVNSVNAMNSNLLGIDLSGNPTFADTFATDFFAEDEYPIHGSIPDDAIPDDAIPDDGSLRGIGVVPEEELLFGHSLIAVFEV